MAFVARHPETLQRENAAIRPFALLGEAETREGIAALEEVQPGLGNDIQAVRRLGRRADGEFLIGLEFPVHPLDEHECPWANKFSDGLLFGLQYEALRTGVEILAGADSPTRECERRRALMQQQQALSQERERRAEAEREQRGREEEARQKRIRDFDRAGFLRLHPWQRLCVRLALIMPEHGAEIRALISQVEGNGESGPTWPDREWRR